MSKHYLKYGGVHFVNNVSPEEINPLCQQPCLRKRRSSLYQRSLTPAAGKMGLISLIDDDITTIDHTARRVLGTPTAGDELK